MTFPQTFVPKGLTSEQVAQLFDMEVTYMASGGVMAMGKLIRRGEVLVQHKHAFPHLSILCSGTIILELDGKITREVGPKPFDIPAHKHHGVKALTDAYWFCIHAEGHDEAVDATDLTEAHEMAARLKGM